MAHNKCQWGIKLYNFTSNIIKRSYPIYCCQNIVKPLQYIIYPNMDSLSIFAKNNDQLETQDELVSQHTPIELSDEAKLII